MASKIEEFLNKILSSRYGKDVRQAIHDGIHQCYEDGKAGSTDLIARERIDNLVANGADSEGNSELIDIRVGYDGTRYTNAGKAVREQIGTVASFVWTTYTPEYVSGAYTVGSDNKALYNPMLSDWRCVIVDVSGRSGETYKITTYADRIRPIIFIDNDLNIVQQIPHDTGNPNTKWDVEVTVPKSCDKMLVNCYKGNNITILGYRTPNFAPKEAIPNIVQSSGDSETAIMSQKAVTEYVKKHSTLAEIIPVCMTANVIPIVDEDVPCYIDNLFIGISPTECVLVSTQNVYIRIYDKKIALVEKSHGTGSGHIRLFLKDDNVYETYATLRYTSVTKRQGIKKVLFIGDSITENLSYINPLKTLSDEGTYKVEFLGTLGPEGKKNEGRGGWAAYNYVTNDLSGVSTSKSNAFWDGEAFNFSYYISHNGIDIPDYIFINLGTNDMIRGISDTSDDDNIKNVIVNSYKAMISSIRDYNINVPIILWLPPTRSMAGRNTHLAIDKALKANKFLLEEFDTKTYISNKVYLMPSYLYVNPYTDYSMISTVIDGVEYSDNSEPIHPTEKGGEKIAKGIIRQMMYIDSLLGY